MHANAHVTVIAEAGSNWRRGTPARDFEMARRLVDVAVEAAADIVKFQTYRSKTVYVPEAGDVSLDGAMSRSINEVFDDLEMPYELIPRIAEYCEQVGIEFLSTPFSIALLRCIWHPTSQPWMPQNSVWSMICSKPESCCTACTCNRDTIRHWRRGGNWRRWTLRAMRPVSGPSC